MRTLFRHPALIVALALAATLFLAAQLPGLRINNDIEVFIPPDHPSKLAYERMEEVFGSQSLVDVAVHARSGSILEPDRVLLIRELTSRIRELPHVEEVTSLTSADYIAGTGEGMEASSLTGDDFTGTPSQMYELREKLFSWPEMYRRLVISEDFTSSQIIVSLERGTGTEQRELFYHRLQQVLQEQEEGDLEYHVAGEPVSLVLLKKNMVDDLTYLVPVVCLVVLLVLFLSFRRMGAVLLPMITVLMSTVWAVGAMPLLGMYFSMISTVVPVLLIAVGSAYVIHLFTQY
ncbi:MAG: MMPL family transporter, partial [Spirochaetota bacterium]